MTMQILAIIGFVIAGGVFPEMAILIGSGKHASPPMLNILTALSAGLISASFVLGS